MKNKYTDIYYSFDAFLDKFDYYDYQKYIKDEVLGVLLKALFSIREMGYWEDPEERSSDDYAIEMILRVKTIFDKYNVNLNIKRMIYNGHVLWDKVNWNITQKLIIRKIWPLIQDELKCYSVNYSSNISI